MKQRIFIAIHYMEIGGAERSLLGLLNALDTTRYDVDLFVYSHRGEFMSYIPKDINLLPEIPKYTTLERPIKDIVKEGHIDIAIARLFAKMMAKVYMKRNDLTDGSSALQYMANCTTPLLPSLGKYGEYDLAISFLIPHNIVLDKVRAKKKLAWIHTDYSTIQINAKQELKVWGRYDYIASISDSVTDAFLKQFPELADRIVLIENILSPTFVRKQAEMDDVLAEMGRSEDEVLLCSVGRFSPPKNLDSVPQICRTMVDRGVKVRWFLIGFGGDEPLIRKQIAEYGMEDHVIILGKKENPYPYMKACDIYVQPSRYEGKAVTVREAQMLCKPVVITNFPTAKSQLTDGVDGVIVPLDNEGCAEGLMEVMRSSKLQESMIDYMQTHDYGNEHEVEKIYDLI